MFRKLKKCMQDFNKSRFVRALGRKKNKLDLAEYSAKEMMLGQENEDVPEDEDQIQERPVIKDDL